MWQNVVVAVIVGGAAVALILYVWKRIAILRRDSDCGGCEECPLKAECGKKKNSHARKKKRIS